MWFKREPQQFTFWTASWIPFCQFGLRERGWSPIKRIPISENCARLTLLDSPNFPSLYGPGDELLDSGWLNPKWDQASIRHTSREEILHGNQSCSDWGSWNTVGLGGELPLVVLEAEVCIGGRLRFLLLFLLSVSHPLWKEKSVF